MAATQHLKTLLSMIGGAGTFVEVGVLRGTTTVELHQCFPKMTFIGIDSYQCYQDDLGIPYSVSKELAQLNQSIAQKRFDQIGARLLVEDSILAISHFNESSIDAIFLDAYMNKEQVIREVVAWYKIVRPGGLFCGHDAASLVVMQGLDAALRQIEATESVKVLGNEVWYLVKCS